jgi:assimilatory nitrate reductase catalytic subunit
VGRDPTCPPAPGKTAVEMFEAAADGEIKALWIACTNPAQSLPDQATGAPRAAARRVRGAAGRLRHTATAPTPTCCCRPASWGEKDGTVTNSERRISRVRAAVPPPGQARADWRIAVDVASAWSAAPSRRGRPAPVQHAVPVRQRRVDLWNEHRETTRGRDLDITGLSWAALDAPAAVALPEAPPPGTARLYTDGRFATPTAARASSPRPGGPWPSRATRASPFALTTGRLRDQWHGMSRTGTLGRLFAHASRARAGPAPAGPAAPAGATATWCGAVARAAALVLPVRQRCRWRRRRPSSPCTGARMAGRARACVNALTSRRLCPQSSSPN